MDPLGQGVSKQAESITFIEKTLPGESGSARLRKLKKNVRFAQLESLEVTADNRTDADCEHFAQCPGCHYLHTDYLSELKYKQAALQRALGKIKFEALPLIYFGWISFRIPKKIIGSFQVT